MQSANYANCDQTDQGDFMNWNNQTNQNRLTGVTRLTREIFPPDRIREGWCKNCQTCEIANLQFRSVSQLHIIISARDASASENI